MRWLLLPVVLLSCSSGDGESSSGAGVTPATSQAIARVEVGATAGCASVPAVRVGQFADATAHRPVKNGDAEDAENVGVTCRVAPNAGGFGVKLSITKGSMSIAVEDDVDARGGSATAKVDLASGNATWSSTSCTLDATGVQMGIAAGRYWALATCNGMTSTGGASCDVVRAEVRVENCAQE